MGVRVRWTALLALFAALGLTACSGGPSDPALTPAAVVAPAADCMSPAVLNDLGLVSAAAEGMEMSPTSSPEPGPVPDGFILVSVVVCTPDGSLKDASVTWLALTA